jgi:hypothetical protein
LVSRIFGFDFSVRFFSVSIRIDPGPQCEVGVALDARTGIPASRRAGLSKVVYDSAKYPWSPPLPNG